MRRGSGEGVEKSLTSSLVLGHAWGSLVHWGETGHDEGERERAGKLWKEKARRESKSQVAVS